jgi:hypothetical protein
MSEIDINEKLEDFREAQMEANKEIFKMDLDKAGIETLRGLSKRTLEKGREEFAKKSKAK